MSRQLKPGQLRTGVLYDITSSFALTASYVEGLNVSADKIVSGYVTASVQSGINAFLITSASLDLFKVQNNGVIVLATQSMELSNPAPYGGIYFTSSSLFVGLD